MFILYSKLQRSPEQENGRIKTMLCGDNSGRHEKDGLKGAESSSGQIS